MALLLLNVSKVLGVAGIITVAANTFAFLRVHRKKLAPFESPIDESQEVLASFPINKDVDDEGFFFAISTAPTHLEEDTCFKFPVGSEVISSKKVDESDKPQVLRSYGSAKGTNDQKEMVSEAEDGSQLKLSELQTDLKFKSRGEQRLNEGTDIKHRNGDQTLEIENASTVCVDELLSENLQNEEGRRQSKDSLETPLDEWEILTCEQMAEREQSAHDQVCSCYSQSGMENRDYDAPKDLSKRSVQDLELHDSLTKKGKELLDPTLEGLMKGLENVTSEQKVIVAQPNICSLEENPRFWSNTDKELHLAKETNATVVHMSIDWNRIMPEEPINGIEKAINWEALDRYRWFIERVHAHGLRVMLTLFHHSLPPWASAYGGWKLDKTIDYFLEYTRLVVDRFNDLVDFWITFSEPHVYALMAYCSGGWFGGQSNLLQAATTVLSQGVFKRVMNRMAAAHLKAYDIIHDTRKMTSCKMNVGISHHISFMRPYGLFDIPMVELNNWVTRFTYVDSVCSKLDFLGINYGGQEFISSAGLKLVDNEEYSEAGRGIYPDGLYRILLDFHNRYKKLNLPFIITENGVADSTDYLRKPYILEHLLAVKAAMKKGVPVKGYCFWALSDNQGCGNGNGPKFGLAAIDDCESNLKHIPRPSYYLFSEIAKSGSITKEQRERAWAELQTAVLQGNSRLLCHGLDGQSTTYAGGLENTVQRRFVGKDWRFGHYRPNGLHDPLSCTVKCIFRLPQMISRKEKNL
eukprot:Gb_25847 [translate_table: standard]